MESSARGQTRSSSAPSRTQQAAQSLAQATASRLPHWQVAKRSASDTRDEDSECDASHAARHYTSAEERPRTAANRRGRRRHRQAPHRDADDPSSRSMSFADSQHDSDAASRERAVDSGDVAEAASRARMASAGHGAWEDAVLLLPRRSSRYFDRDEPSHGSAGSARSANRPRQPRRHTRSEGESVDDDDDEAGRQGMADAAMQRARGDDAEEDEDEEAESGCMMIGARALAESDEKEWREMQEVEQATQQWQRAIGAMHTSTVVQQAADTLRRSPSAEDAKSSKGHTRGSNNSGSSTSSSRSSSRSGTEEELQGHKMHYGVLEDPRSAIVNMILNSATGSVMLNEIRDRFDWDNAYERTYGSVAEYLQGYQAIFIVSPVDDRVTLRRVRILDPVVEHDDEDEDTQRLTGTASQVASQPPQQRRGAYQQRRRSPSLRSGMGRRGMASRPGTIATVQQAARSHSRRRRQRRREAVEVVARSIGSISYSCVADGFDLDELEVIYRRRGYDVTLLYDVLHVASSGVFDLFLFPNGVVVWWGANRSDHWMVEDDFLSHTSYVRAAMRERYAQKDIETLFPNWCSFEEDDAYGEPDTSVSPMGFRQGVIDAGLARLSRVLCFDHYLIPRPEPGRSQVMLTLSHSLGRSARADYFEYITQWSHRHVLSIPSELGGLLEYYTTKRRIPRLEGELQVAILGITSLKDTPDFLWEMPWLEPYYDLAEAQNSSEQRLSWFSARSDALLEQLRNLKTRRYRLFLLGSDVFLIVLLIIDVLCMTARLVVAMYMDIRKDD